jgi:hypothetical protein
MVYGLPMKYFFYFTYHRLYQWSEKQEKNIPIVIVLTWMAITSYFNIYTALSLIDICFGVYAERALTIPTSRVTSLMVMSSWAFSIWILLKLFHVKEKAFSPEYIEKYRELKCKDWWIYAYFLVSLVAMGWVGWIAGARHRS